MTELFFTLGGVLLGAVVAYAIAIARSSSHTETAANKRADEREARVREEADRRIADLKEQHSALRDQFKAMAGEVLEKSSETLMATAEERFKRAQQTQDAEMAKREQAVKQLVEPMAKALDEVKKQTSEADKMRAAAHAAVTEQVQNLRQSSERLGKETTALKDALRRPEVRGRWGELHLRRVVEVAGLVNHVDFVEQATTTDEEGARLRPDMIVKLAGDRTIVVDAKTPVDALLDIGTAESDDDRERHLDRHVQNVRKRVTELKSKKYTAQFESSVEFVVLFLPAESFLQAALERDPQLQEWAYEQGVVIATPTILVALLRTVGHAWKQDALAQNAKDVLATGKELYDRLAKMGDHLARLGKAIDAAGKSYNDTIGALERRVLPSARKMGRLQQIESDIQPAALETEIREIAAPELTDTEED